MAFLSADRFNKVKVNPVPLTESFELTAAAEIFAGSLCCVLDADGKIESLNNAASMRAPAEIAFVAYSDQKLKAGEDNPRTHTGGLDADTFEVLTGIDVYLNAATLGIGDEGQACYAVDDNTIDNDSATNSLPYVGIIKKVLTTTLCIVHIPGATQPQV